jgi:HEPN domain-containing protein
MKEETKLWIDTAEKYLKAYLVEQGIEFPRTHDLMLLIDRFIQPIDQTFSELKNSAAMLTEFAVVARYPDVGENLDIVTARNAYQQSSLIRSFVRAKINNEEDLL